jgi:hypothetical protein
MPGQPSMLIQTQTAASGVSGLRGSEVAGGRNRATPHHDYVYAVRGNYSDRAAILGAHCGARP